MRKSQQAIEGTEQTDAFVSLYPYIASWVVNDGWIEMGDDECSSSFVRAMDAGGLVWEGKKRYKSVDVALRALDKGIRDYMEEQGIDL